MAYIEPQKEHPTVLTVSSRKATRILLVLSQIQAMSPTVYLVSGANRGIGLGIVTQLAAGPDTIVFAGARDPSKASDLSALSSKHPDTFHVVQLTSADKASNEAAIAEIRRVAGRLDVIIANAGISSFFGDVLDTSPEVAMEHQRVNFIGPLVLFQSAWPLLQKSPHPKFAIISSLAGSIQVGAALPSGLLSYGASKAAVNYLAVKMHNEHKDLTVRVLNPGGVATDMAAFAQASDALMAQMQLITVQESAAGILSVVDTAIRKEDEPKLTNYDGAEYPW
ncbi:NAD(P)-binding protein [Calocera cornea HHB12733]|uniref:NAD(P)-binding protein n=1 Tax=Calocera cornea HHB12733 TaxID=1353952 RepID=A0A165E8Z0_9BASI|nr:NAD(P)-binding protein [Calocera cornea HHB12733]